MSISQRAITPAKVIPGRLGLGRHICLADNAGRGTGKRVSRIIIRPDTEYG